MSICEKLLLKGSRARSVLLSETSLPLPRIGSARETATCPISRSGRNESVTTAPSPPRSTRRRARRSPLAASTWYVPEASGGNLNRPFTSLTVLSVRLLPVAVTLAPAAGAPPFEIRPLKHALTAVKRSQVATGNDNSLSLSNGQGATEIDRRRGKSNGVIGKSKAGEGARKTRQRQALTEILERADRPLSVEELLDAASRRVDGLGVATVYRAVSALLEAAWIESVE